MVENGVNDMTAWAREDGVYKSACRMCHGGCGALVRVKDGRVVKVEGDPESPFNKGKMCPKGLASIEHLYNPKRLTHPLRRAGARGSGKWERITWDEALGEMAEKINAVREAFGPEAVAVGQGTGRSYYRHVIRFAHAIGTPNWCEPGLAQCLFPRVLASRMTYGAYPVCDYYGDVNPACVLAWGANPTVSGADGEIQFRARACLQKGARLIVVDPRRTKLARQADIWLPVRPGTDAALALAMIHVIIEEGLYDKAFVADWTTGFDKLAERAREYPPGRAAEITDVPAESIIAAARLFARTRPGTLEWGVGIEQSPNAFQTVRAISLLPGLCGYIDVPGGFILGMNVLADIPPLTREGLSMQSLEKCLGAGEFRVLSGPTSPMPSAHIPTLFRAMRTGEPYPVRAFLIFGNNGLLTYANAKEVRKTFMSLDFMSVMDLYMTPTAELADIVLPAATWLEMDEVIGLPFLAHNAALAHQKIVRIGECRQVEEALVDIAKRMGLDVVNDSLEASYDRQLSKLGVTFSDLKERGCADVPFVYRKFEQRGFRTPSKKVELCSSALEKLGYDPLPYYREPPESPRSAPELAREYPLILTTGGRSQYYFCSEYRQVPSLRARDPHPQAEIHTDAARKAGIEDGDWMWIETQRGRIRQKARVSENIKPGVVNAQFGWWLPEDETPDHGAWESNANVLTSDAPPYDPAMGTYQLRALLCKVYKADEGVGAKDS
ncbi:MAG: molybdopterin-dependent oxidoreductase [Syntrophobacteraceae bacterium]